MSVTRPTYCRVTVDGIPLSQVISAQSIYGFDQMVSTATVVVPTVPSWAQFKSVVTIDMGGTAATSQRRFTGLLTDFDFALFPRQVSLLCRGYLFLADLTQNSNSGGTDLSGGGAGATDESMVTTVLNDCGITNLNQVNGTGLTLGTIAQVDGFTWNEGQSGLDFIRQLDSVCLGYRTFDTFSGSVTRQKIVTAGSPTAAFTFTEGTDIEKGDSQQTMREIRNRVLVTGYNTGSGSYNGAVQVAVRQDSPFLAHDVTQDINSSMIEQELTGTTPGLNCQDVGTWLVQETNRILIKTPFTTPRDDLIPVGATVAISPASGRLGTPSTATTGWVQSVTNEYLEDGGYQQTIQLLSGIGSSAPVSLPPIADFTILVETESVVISGTQQTIYIVSCQDASLAYGGTITAWAWSSSGTPSSGTANYYVTEYSSISAQSITLQVTDSNGATNSVSKVISDTQTAAEAYTRQLYLANTTDAEAFDGAAYNDQADPNAYNVTVVANGPVWGAGVDALVSTDDLATAPTATNPFSDGETVTALYVATWVDANQVLAGSSGGNIALSSDAGNTWTLLVKPSGGSVLKLSINPFDTVQYYALYSGALWLTQDGGNTWTVVSAAQAGETYRDFVNSFARWMIVMDGGRLMVDYGASVTQTFPTLSPAVSDVVCVAPHIREDRFCCIDSEGRTFYHAASGDTALVQGADIPTGTQQARGIVNDGDIPGLIYAALGSGGAWKHTEFFNGSGNWYQLRDPGVDTSPSDAVYTMIGADGNLSGQVFTPFTLNSTAGDGKVDDLGVSGTPPFGWQNANYDDSGWAASASITGSVGTPITDTAWIGYADSNEPIADVWLFRQTFTLSAGLISAANIQIAADNSLLGVWINGTFIGQSIIATSSGDSVYPPVTFTIPVSALLAGTTNILAIEIQNCKGETLGGPTSVDFQLVVS